MTPWYVHLVLVRPARVRANLRRACEALDVQEPTDWQLCLGVLRLWHRVLLRSETVGTSQGPIRRTLRARLLAWRALRLPFLLGERAVVPLDFTGLGSTPERLIRHLLAAHHDGDQFVYDLELLAAYDRLAELRAEVVAVIERDDAWLRDLVVFDGYHESLLAAIDCMISGGSPAAGPHASGSWRALAGDTTAAADPDISLRAYLRWCASQPSSPAATLDAWRTGAFRFDSALEAA